MPQKIDVYKLFFAHPSDIDEEYSLVDQIVQEWNLHHGEASCKRVQMCSWKTHSFPSTGDRPQALINRQILDDADFIVGVFWSKFGSPTGEADSGTEEEIIRALSAEKQVMLYFSDRPIPPSKISPQQIEKISIFKENYKDKGIYWCYNSAEEFQSLFRQHLYAMMNHLTGTMEAKPPSKEDPDALDIPISVELRSRHWLTILAGLEDQIRMVPTLLQRITAAGKGPEEFNHAELAVTSGPIVARSVIIDALAKHGLITATGKKEFGTESLTRLIQNFHQSNSSSS